MILNDRIVVKIEDRTAQRENHHRMREILLTRGGMDRKLS